MKTVIKFIILTIILILERVIGLPVLFIMLSLLWLSPLPFIFRLISSFLLSYVLAIVFFLPLSLSWLAMTVLLWIFPLSSSWMRSFSLRTILTTILGCLLFFIFVSQQFELKFLLYILLITFSFAIALKLPNWSRVKPFISGSGSYEN